MTESKIIKFISYPSSDSVNPFIKLLNNALAQIGYQEIKHINLLYSFKNAFKYKNSIRILHFHWPESLWRNKYLVLSIIKAIRFIVAISYLRIFGYKLVFSAHNVVPHFGKVNVLLEKTMRKIIIKKFDLVIGHSYLTYDELITTYNITPHNYVLAIHGLYNNYLSLQGKEYLAIQHSKKIKLYLQYSENEYKGSAWFIDLFGKLPDEVKNHFCLILTGDGRIEVNEQIKKNNITHIWIEGEKQNKSYLDDEELVGLIKTVDFVVLPYKKTTTSGAYFLALTFDKPVIATKLPFFEAHSNKHTALLYDGTLHSLLNALTKIIDGWQLSQKELDQVKRKFSWDESAKNIAQMYDKLIKI